MDDGVSPTERRTTADRRSTARPGADRRTTPRPRATPTGKTAQRTRKAAASPSNISVADRIDPLMGSTAPDVLDPAPVRPATKNSTRARPSTPRKRSPSARKAPDAEAPTNELPRSDLTAFDDLLVFDEPLPTNGEVEPTAHSLVPRVVPTIAPSEAEPDANTTEAPEAGGEKIAKRAFKPTVLRMTRRLARSIQPVVVRRHRPRVRRVTRVVRHIDTWSVFKIALLFNIFLYAVTLTAGVMLWRVALSTGTIENVERFFESFGWQTFELKGGEIYHNAWIAGLFGVVGLTGLAVLVATVFNLITDLVGGIRVTVLEEEVTAREPYVVSWPRLLRPGTPPRDQPRAAPPAESAID